MGIDIDQKHKKQKHKHLGETKTRDPYRRLLIQLYKFLYKKTGSKFNKTVLRRLAYTKVNRVAVSLSRIYKATEKAKEGDISVVVANVVNDERLFDFPARTIAAIQFSETARQRIEKAGGRCLTFDQLALERPTGSGCLLLKGSRFRSETFSHFRGIRGKHAKPYEGKRNLRRNTERKRGRRKSRGGVWNH
eukprot:TRINITY_DN352_c0_g1_i2.p1 TRINITY_DN352_c0_g1~~TRINITY_DN352_c0_g1_i2.p1  ORF type:complete len:191 (+),score=32.78 TRINITY_DN352_c0_g1_i2:91-663(+)